MNNLLLGIGKPKSFYLLKEVASLLAVLLLLTGTTGLVWAAELDRTRIVVLPFFTEEGQDAKEGGGKSLHYRRLVRFINNKLVNHNFDVINAYSKDSQEQEYNRILERAREDSPLAAMEMCKKYGVDIAYIVWLKVKIKRTADGYCKARARMDGEGYDSGGRDLGVGVSKTFEVSRQNCDDAIAEVEKEVGYLVGHTLTAWSNRSNGQLTIIGDASGSVVSSGTTTTNRGSKLQREADKLKNQIEIRLDGGTEYEAVEAFGKVINTATGVTSVTRYASQIEPNNPQASFVTWRIHIEDTDPFRLQTNVMKMINDVLDSGGTLLLKGVPYRYTFHEINLLQGIRPGEATSRRLQFVFDRERMRDREFSGRHDINNGARQHNTASPGFE